MRRPILFMVTVALSSLLGAARPAQASDGATSTEVEATVLPGGNPAAPDLAVTERVVDAAGRTVSTDRYTRPSSPRGFMSAGQGQMSCLNDREREGFAAHDPREVYDPEWKNEYVHYMFHPYQQNDARILNGVRTQQWLICATGGAEGENGSRITRSGPSVAYRSESRTAKQGQVWKEGKTPSSHSVTLGFQVGYGPVKVTGSFTQGSASAEIKGSELKPQGSNRYSRNQATSWWEDDPICKSMCRPKWGSVEWQGSVVEALYEFPNSKDISADDFEYTAYWRHHCGTQTGICR